MKLAALNTPAIANAGVAIITAASGALVTIVVRLSNFLPVSTAAIVVAFAALAAGTALAYIGRPSLPPATK